MCGNIRALAPSVQKLRLRFINERQIRFRVAYLDFVYFHLPYVMMVLRSLLIPQTGRWAKSVEPLHQNGEMVTVRIKSYSDSPNTNRYTSFIENLEGVFHSAVYRLYSHPLLPRVVMVCPANISGACAIIGHFSQEG